MEVNRSERHGGQWLCRRCYLTRRPLLRFEVLFRLDPERPQSAAQLAADLGHPVRSISRALAELGADAQRGDDGWRLCVSAA